MVAWGIEALLDNPVFSGTATFDGSPAMTIPAGAATSEILTSDALGDATWQPAGSGTSGGYLCAPVVLAPAIETSYTAVSTTFAALSAGVVATGDFTAPASGKVMVTVSFNFGVTNNSLVGLALAATGTVTPLLSNQVTFGPGNATTVNTDTVVIPVSGLTPGDVYNLDVLAAMAVGTLTVYTVGSTATLLGSHGPLVITVQGI